MSVAEMEKALATMPARRLMTKHDGSEMKAEIIKWMFIFWVGQVIFTVGIMKFMR